MSYDALGRWCRGSGTLGSIDSGALTATARAAPETAALALRKLIRLREVLHRIFTAVSRGAPPSPADISRVERAVRRAARHRTLAPLGSGFRWSWDVDGCLDAPADLAAWSAADLLTSTSLDRVRQCEHDSCSWLFLDRSRNRTRRWCVAGTYGNRSRVQRHYRRSRQA